MEVELQAELSAVDGKTPSGVSPDFIKKIWSIYDEEAAGVVQHNTQLNKQTGDGLLSRQFSTNDRML